MNRQIIFFLILIFSASGSASTADWKLAWRVEGLPSPESAVFDPKRSVIFISHQNYAQESGGGSIGMISTNGAVIEREWVRGLNKPKGILVLGDKLFVSDVTELVEIDIAAGAILKRYPGKGAKFLNDVATDGTGMIYVSDMFTSAIYRLDRTGQFDVWMKDPALENPNGLLFHKGSLYISAWGAFVDDKPLSSPPGHFLQVSLKDKKIRRLSASPLGHLDGIVPMDENFLVSDWIAGGVFQVTPAGVVERIIMTEQSAGDIAYLPEQELILIPMAKQGQLLAYTKSGAPRALGVRRDHSYYTRVEWTNATLPTPLYWVANLNDDDTARNGGSWGAPTMGSAEAVLSFFGEEQIVRRIRIFHNVGASVSPLDELAKKINIYVSSDPQFQRIGDSEAKLEDRSWKRVVSSSMKQEVGWTEFVLKTPTPARYVRLQLVENFGTPKERAFTETNEIKIYP